jgi:hypothetical protein
VGPFGVVQVAFHYFGTNMHNSSIFLCPHGSWPLIKNSGYTL